MPIRELDSEEHQTFVFPQTVFTAVTAYQNQLVSAEKSSSVLQRRNVLSEPCRLDTSVEFLSLSHRVDQQ